MPLRLAIVAAWLVFQPLASRIWTKSAAASGLRTRRIGIGISLPAYQ